MSDLPVNLKFRNCRPASLLGSSGSAPVPFARKRTVCKLGMLFLNLSHVLSELFDQLLRLGVDAGDYVVFHADV
jgi:hypothetical protein